MSRNATMRSLSRTGLHGSWPARIRQKTHGSMHHHFGEPTEESRVSQNMSFEHASCEFCGSTRSIARTTLSPMAMGKRTRQGMSGTAREVLGHNAALRSGRRSLTTESVSSARLRAPAASGKPQCNRPAVNPPAPEACNWDHAPLEYRQRPAPPKPTTRSSLASPSKSPAAKPCDANGCNCAQTELLR